MEGEFALPEYPGWFYLSYYVVQNVTTHDDVPDGYESFSCSANFTILARLRINEEGELREWKFEGGRVFLWTKDIRPYYVIKFPRPTDGKIMTIRANWSDGTFGRVLQIAHIEYANKIHERMERIASKLKAPYR